MIKSELVIVRDKNNNPNIMRRYEKCLHREVDPSIEGDAVHPMFIIRGKEVDAIYLPEYLSCIKDSASLEATAAENARLKAIDEIAGQISDKMVADAKYGEKKVTAEALALEAFRQNGIMAAAALSDMKEDISESGAGEVAPSANTGLADDSGEQREAKVNNLAQKIKESRGKRA